MWPTEENCRIFLLLLPWTHPTTSGVLIAGESSANLLRTDTFRNAKTSRVTRDKQFQKFSTLNCTTPQIDKCNILVILELFDYYLPSFSNMES
jgi:hypothetical protein